VTGINVIYFSTKTAVTEEYQTKVIKEMERANAQMFEYEALIEKLNNMEYTPETRDEIKNLAERFITQFKDYRAHMLKTCKKSELIQTLITILTRTNSDLSDYITLTLSNELARCDKHFETIAIGRKRDALLEKVYPYENQYINDFDNVREGIRAWDCLLSCIESGYITETNLGEYGIDLSMEPVKL